MSLESAETAKVRENADIASTLPPRSDQPAFAATVFRTDHPENRGNFAAPLPSFARRPSQPADNVGGVAITSGADYFSGNSTVPLSHHYTSSLRQLAGSVDIVANTSGKAPGCEGLVLPPTFPVRPLEVKVLPPPTPPVPPPVA